MTSKGKCWNFCDILSERIINDTRIFTTRVIRVVMKYHKSNSRYGCVLRYECRWSSVSNVSRISVVVPELQHYATLDRFREY